MISLQPSFIQQTKFFFIVVSMVLISACSSKILYNQLDYIIQNYVGEYITLDDVLEEKVEQRTQFLINWHRNTQLKDYADWLRILQKDVNTHLTDKILFQHINNLEYFWTLLSQKFHAEMAGLLPLLTLEQRTELFTSFTEKNQSFSDNYIGLDEKKRIENYKLSMLDNYETWLGDLNAEQEKAIEQAASGLQSTAVFRLRQRLLWQQGVQKIIETNEVNEATVLKSERLRVFFADYLIQKNPEKKKMDALNRRILVQLTLKIMHGLTTEQKNHFMSNTNDYIRIFTELSENR